MSTSAIHWSEYRRQISCQLRGFDGSGGERACASLIAQGARLGENRQVSVTISTGLPPPKPPLPVARVVRPKAPAIRRDELVTWLAMLIFLVVVYWYGLSLPRPHH
jgi:hypothetical protein